MAFCFNKGPTHKPYAQLQLYSPGRYSRRKIQKPRYGCTIMKWVVLTTFVVWLDLVTAEAHEGVQKREVKVDFRRSPWEYAVLKHLMGYPKGNPKTAKALKGERRTTRLHRLCSGKITLRDEWTKDRSTYDKIICGMFTRKDLYKKHEDHVARIISGQTEKKTWEEQKKELIRAVNQMVKAAGPIPMLHIGKR